ncbi:microcephalin [Leuresthes tenuis]|uniref:microcephalin n=1 Tax=Leuresthes tenuis TaxID=355514 RepID=UPI003B503569
MTTSNNTSVLKDVVAYVDVWSSDKRANYSKPFIQQLQEMGAEVSKRFNKQVTHVVFNNGHPATWRKAKKSDVRLVSVLWVGRCYDDGVCVDEDLFPAVNDESNPVMKNRKHRCMLPKDSPERTTENDWRMRKKLDKMMKDLTPKQPLVTDMSPIIIDQENGIIYSPALKRSDYMAQRLKDMKDKQENLSPTASQMAESCSPVGLKPSLGSTPTVFKFKLDDQSDDDSSASVAELGCSPDKEEGRSYFDVKEHGCVDSATPWLSPCHDVPKRIASVPDCPNFKGKEDEDGNKQTKSRISSARKRAAEKFQSADFLESPFKDRSDKSKNVHKEQSQSLSPNKSEKGKQRVTDTESHIYPDTVNSLSCLSSLAMSVDAAATIRSKETSVLSAKMEQKTPKRSRSSLSALVRSATLPSECKRFASGSTEEDNDVFEDYFSPANHKRPILPNLPMKGNIQIPFELGSVTKKRKQRSKIFGSETKGKKPQKLEESQSGKHVVQRPDATSEPQSVQQQDVKTLTALDSPTDNVTLMAERRRQSTVAFPSSTKTTSDAGRWSTASTSGLQTDDITVSELQKNSDFTVLSHTLESGGNECTAAAGFTEIPSETEENYRKHFSLGLQKMVNNTKAMRTLVMTSMPSEKQHTVVQVVKALGGFSVVDRVCESTTHVVSGGHKRTLNILLGIARGCWILSFEWILWCLEQRQWIPEEPYELSDQFPAAQICRLQRHLSAGEHQQDLFQGQPAMFVSQHSQPPTQSLVELIELCGGTVCKTVRQAGICIGKYSGRRPEGSRILSEQWILDSITNLKIISYENYNLE